MPIFGQNYISRTGYQNAEMSISKEFKPTQNLLSITDHDFENFGGQKVVIWTILAP